VVDSLLQLGNGGGSSGGGGGATTTDSSGSNQNGSGGGIRDLLVSRNGALFGAGVDSVLVLIYVI